MKKLFLDTETSPAQVFSYERYDTNICPDQVIHTGFFLSMQAAWEGGRVFVDSIRDKHRKPFLTDQDDRELTMRISALVSEADIVIAHNANRFDLGYLSARLAAHNLPPYNPPQVIDTLSVCRRRFRFEANSLDAVGQYLKLGRKFHSGGFKTTIACMQGDQKAWNKLLKYGKQDVILLRDIYNRVFPWIKDHPDLSPRDPHIHCPKCKATHLIKMGVRFNKTQAFHRYQCKECHSWTQVLMKDTKSVMRSA